MGPEVSEGISIGRMLRSLKILLMERDTLHQQIKVMKQERHKTRISVKNMLGQAGMMMTLMKDLMNQAQLANNTFTMVNDYFDCIFLIKKCMATLKSQCKFKHVSLAGPVFENPVNKYYFRALYSDEQRYG